MYDKKRDTRIDIVKAIGIILMVFYHAGTPGKDFVYHFHMALFFICSGFCYSHKSEGNVKEYIKRKIKTLYVPCFISGFIVACLHNFLLDIHIYSYDVYEKQNLIGWIKQVLKCLMFAGGHQMIGANWFFRTLFLSSVLYMLLNKLLVYIVKNDNKRTIVRMIICFLFTFVGGYLGTVLSFGKYFNFLTVMILLDTGFIIKKYQLLSFFNSIFLRIIVAISSLCILVILSRLGEISINSNIIINPLYFFICSSTGYIIVYLMADIINKTRMKSIFSYIGQNSIWIMFFHYIGFKIVTLCEIIIMHEPIDNLSAYPAHHTNNGLWAVYGICGTLIPLLFVVFGKLIKALFYEKQLLKRS